MIVTGITCVRNEADIIESFVRHNLNYIDHLLIIDNCSTDKTIEILLLMKQEGLNIDIKTFPPKDHQQELAFNIAINQLATDGSNFDFCVLLDADEFIQSESREFFKNELATCSTGFYPVLQWKTYIANPEINISNLNITNYMTHRREPEGEALYKSIIPKILFNNCNVWPGNHGIRSINGDKLEMQHIQSKLGHIPIRSKEQAITKLLLGSHSLSLKSNKVNREGLHWVYLSDQIRKNNYTLSNNDVINFSLAYGYPLESLDQFSIIFDPMQKFENSNLKYQHLATTSTIERLDKYIFQLIEEITVNNKK